MSIKELEKLIKQLKKEQSELNKKLGLKTKIDKEKRWQINIINKEEASDTWEIEP